MSLRPARQTAVDARDTRPSVTGQLGPDTQPALPAAEQVTPRGSWPNHATAGPMRHTMLRQAQRALGNAGVQRMVAGIRSSSAVIQRCSCGRQASQGGECAECRERRLATERNASTSEASAYVSRLAEAPLQRVSWEGAASETACALLSDEQIYELFRDVYFSSQPNAQRHLVHYRTGGGAPYTENVDALFSANPRIRTRIARLISNQIAGGTTTRGSIVGRGADDGKEPPIRQSDYDSEDWRNANGNIDQVDWELVGTYNPNAYNQVRITVSDPYTWHPMEGRPTQCLHAAFERLKAHGAADYTTTGTATIQLPPVNQSPDLPLEPVY